MRFVSKEPAALSVRFIATRRRMKVLQRQHFNHKRGDVDSL